LGGKVNILAIDAVYLVQAIIGSHPGAGLGLYLCYYFFVCYYTAQVGRALSVGYHKREEQIFDYCYRLKQCFGDGDKVFHVALIFCCLFYAFVYCKGAAQVAACVSPDGVKRMRIAEWGFGI
jgi:hypothetical protein